jgi:hypothetical protein
MPEILASDQGQLKQICVASLLKFRRASALDFLYAKG